MNANTAFRKSNLSFIDNSSVYIGKDKILRAINENDVEHFLSLLKCGLVEELVSKDLLPKTTISKEIIKGFSIVLEHEKIAPVIYPYEWSPEMMRKAALCVLNVNKCANLYGYELKDAHPYNVVFDHATPKYVDFGSIVKIKSQVNNWIAETEFIECYYNHLMLAKRRMRHLFKYSFLIKGTGIPSDELAMITNPFFSCIGVKLTRYILLFKKSRKKIAHYDENRRRRLFKIIKMLKRLASVYPYKTDFYKITKKIQSMKLDIDTQWGDYHQKYGLYNEKENKIDLSDRMKSIVSIVKTLQVRTILELAGNQGVLSRTISNLPNIDRVICSDYDATAIDRLILSGDNSVFPACFDFMHDFHEEISGERSARLKSDLVIALAVTHHLVLSQGYSIDGIFSKIYRYTEKYILIEFMPLGLWNGEYAPPVPSYYNEMWFTCSMSKFFLIKDRVQTEKNRVLFLGEKNAAHI